MNKPHADNHRLLLIERVLLLKSLNLFQDTPETILAEMAHLMHEMEVSEDTMIFKEGEIGSCMYIIYKGAVQISKGSQTLAMLGERDFFGELSLLDTENRSASAKAAKDTILYYIDQEPFYDLMESRPEVVRGIMRILSQRLRSANQRILELTRK
jgi:CRP/FNR family transcriptional regulator, cyclic AMP receptor protein